jgi:peptide/nickel transport system substrate-binding protein
MQRSSGSRSAKGVVFHDGNPLTADDVLKTMQRNYDEKATSGALGIMKGIESMRAEGDLFEITLPDANADLPYLMSDPHLYIHRGGGIENPARDDMSGAYKIVVIEPGVYRTFEKFADYWDDTRVHFDSSKIFVVNGATARIAALQSGQVHIANLIEPKIAGLSSTVSRVVLEQTQGRGELDPAKRKSIYRELSMMMRVEGGLIMPMFNDFLDARSDRIAG